MLPNLEHVQTILNFGRSVELDSGRKEGHLLVHCHAGVSRSTASMAILMAQADPGQDEDTIFNRILDLRPQAWPNSLMVGFADNALKREGRLLAALYRLYAKQLSKDPELEHFLRRYGRGREVARAAA